MANINNINLPQPQKIIQSFNYQDKKIEYDNYCLLLGIPEELTEEDVSMSLRAQELEVPVQYEWKNEGPTVYLKAYFKSVKAARDLIIRKFNIGVSSDNMIYPIMTIPWLEDKTVSDMLLYHQVQVDSSISVDSFFLYLFYVTYGEIIDIVEVTPLQHVIIFAKQPHTQQVLNIPQISIPQANIDVIIKHSRLEKSAPIKRKSVKNHIIEGVMQRMNEIKSTPIPNIITTHKAFETSSVLRQDSKPSLPPTQHHLQLSQTSQPILPAQVQLVSQTLTPAPLPHIIVQSQVQDLSLQQSSNPKVFTTDKKYETKSKTIRMRKRVKLFSF